MAFGIKISAPRISAPRIRVPRVTAGDIGRTASNIARSDIGTRATEAFNLARGASVGGISPFAPIPTIAAITVKDVANMARSGIQTPNVQFGGSVGNAFERGKVSAGNFAKDPFGQYFQAITTGQVENAVDAYGHVTGANKQRKEAMDTMAQEKIAMNRAVAAQQAQFKKEQQGQEMLQEREKARQDYFKFAGGLGGRASTILTGPLGVTGSAMGSRKILLGT